MGDRADIIIYKDGDVVEYHTHWSATIFPKLFEEYMKMAKELSKGQLHWLTYPEDIGAYLSFIDGMTRYENFKDEPLFPIKPDFYPRGSLRDTDGYAYIVIPEKIIDDKIMYRIIKAEVGFDGIPDDIIELLKQRKLREAIKKLKIVEMMTITV